MSGWCLPRKSQSEIRRSRRSSGIATAIIAGATIGPSGTSGAPLTDEAHVKVTTRPSTKLRASSPVGHAAAVSPERLRAGGTVAGWHRSKLLERTLRHGHAHGRVLHPE